MHNDRFGIANESNLKAVWKNRPVFGVDGFKLSWKNRPVFGVDGFKAMVLPSGFFMDFTNFELGTLMIA